MKKIIYSLLILLFSFGTPFAQLKLPQKHELDKRTYRTLTLENQLKVILISDPSFNKSAASMQVAVGSLDDPKNRQGMAHYLEHMLFLGTKKYPDVDEYGNYLKQRGGYSNAFTAGNRTNYQLQIFHDAFEGALDRFSQFFIAPLFNPEYTSREMNIVHSEHEKNLMNDTWRRYQLMTVVYKKDHPENHFGTGNKETLKGVNSDELKEFYHRYYSANTMTLCLMSKKSLDWLEEKTKKYFSSIKNRNVKEPQYPIEYLEQKETVRLLKMKPIKDQRQLILEFSLPEIVSDYKHKSLQILGKCIGHEGKGSLLSLLKKENLATALSSGAHLATKNYGSFVIKISLTPHGVKNWKQCVLRSFEYINLLKKEGYKDYLYHEIKTKSQLDDIYTDKGEGTGQAIKFSNYIYLYPLELAKKIDAYFEAANPDSYNMYLSYLKPSNMTALLISKDVKTDKKEPIYGTDYSLIHDDSLFQTISKAGLNKNLHLPEPNPFVPQSAKVYKKRPIQLLDRDDIELWYMADETFLRPKVGMIYKFRFPKSFVSAQNMALLDLYTTCLQEQLKEYSYPAMEAGLHFNITSDAEGLIVNVQGFNDGTKKLAHKVFSELQNFNLPQSQFDAIKERILRAYDNFDKNQAYQVARYYNRKLYLKTFFLPEEKIKTVKNANLQNMQTFSKHLFSNIRLQAFIHGHITAKDSMLLSLNLLNKFDYKAIPSENLFQQEYLSLKENATHTYKLKLPTNNSYFRRNVLLGEEALNMRLYAQILNNFISQPFYTELRTKQQLGYIVFAGSFTYKKYQYLTFIVQSGSHGAEHLRDKSIACISTLSDLFSQLSDEQFELIKTSIREKIQEKDKSIWAVSNRYNALTYSFNENFSRKTDELEALSQISKEKVAILLKKACKPKENKIIDIMLIANNLELKEEQGNYIKDIQTFKQSQSYIP